MRKLIVLAAIAAVSTAANAQISFGVQAGGNLANVKLESTSGTTTVKANTKSKIGFLVGVVAAVPITESLSFRPELNYIQKGFKMDETETIGGITTAYTFNSTLNFIEIPLNIVYSVPAGSGTVFFGAGPSIGYGISGKNKSTYSVTGTPSESESIKVKFDGDENASDNDDHMKALDFGGNILAGYKMSNGIYLNVGYTLGFSNLSPTADASLKTSGLTFKVGYMFGGNASND